MKDLAKGGCGTGYAVPTGWRIHEKAGASSVGRCPPNEGFSERRVLIYAKVKYNKPAEPAAVVAR